jgi:oligopeptide transport system permease protein
VLRFVAARGLQMVLTLWVAVTLLFVVVTVLPGDPVRALFGFQAPPPEVYDAIVRDYHLDQPIWRQYLLYLGDLLRGDLGSAYPRDPFGAPDEAVAVADIVRATAPVSLRLLLAALVVQVVVGIVAGLVAARRGTVAGPAVYGAAVVLVALPVVVLAFVLRTVVGLQLGWLPVRGLYEGAASYVLPVLALAALSTGYVALLTRAEVRDVLGRPFITAARARGFTETRVLALHALRPALVPVVAYLAASTGPAVIGLVVVEGVFELPGLGGAVIWAIRDRDRSVLVGLVAVVMAAVIVVTAVGDVLTAWLDPRLRGPDLA